MSIPVQAIGEMERFASALNFCDNGILATDSTSLYPFPTAVYRRDGWLETKTYTFWMFRTFLVQL